MLFKNRKQNGLGNLEGTKPPFSSRILQVNRMEISEIFQSDIKEIKKIYESQNIKISLLQFHEKPLFQFFVKWQMKWHSRIEVIYVIKINFGQQQKPFQNLDFNLLHFKSRIRS